MGVVRNVFAILHADEAWPQRVTTCLQSTIQSGPLSGANARAGIREQYDDICTAKPPRTILSRSSNRQQPLVVEKIHPAN